MSSLLFHSGQDEIEGWITFGDTVPENIVMGLNNVKCVRSLKV